jgi:hypothetical protein
MSTTTPSLVCTQCGFEPTGGLGHAVGDRCQRWTCTQFDDARLVRASVEWNPVTATLACEGEMDCTDEQRLEAWQYLIDTGLAWTLQGCFGRTAASLIEQGLCTSGGRS